MVSQKTTCGKRGEAIRKKIVAKDVKSINENKP